MMHSCSTYLVSEILSVWCGPHALSSRWWVCVTDGLQCFTALVLQAIHRKQPFPSSVEFHIWLWHVGWLQCGSGSDELQCSAPAIEEENGVSNIPCQLRVIVGPHTAIQNAELNQVSPLGLQKCDFCNGPMLYSVSRELSAGAGAFEVIVRSSFHAAFLLRSVIQST